MSDWSACLTEAEWAWQDEAKVVAVLAILLESAAVSTRRYHSEMLARGDAMTSHAALSITSGLTVKQVRGVLAKLENTGEIESIRRPRGLLIRLLRFEDWQITRRNMETPDYEPRNLHETYSGCAPVNALPESGRNSGGQRAGSGQSHLVYAVKRGLRTNNTPLTPLAAQPLDGQKANSGRPQPAQNSPAPPQSPAASSPLATDNHDLRQREVRQRLDRLIRSERLPLPSGVIDSLAQSPLEYIGLVCEAATEKRDRRSNVVVPTAVAKYRAKQGVQPRPETLDRLRRALYPPSLPPPRMLPRPDCAHCAGSGSVLGERCECVGGRKRTRGEILRLKLERDEAIRRISLQLAGESA